MRLRQSTAPSISFSVSKRISGLPRGSGSDAKTLRGGASGTSAGKFPAAIWERSSGSYDFVKVGSTSSFQAPDLASLASL